MRRLAMRFRGILRSKDIQKFRVWLDDAQQSRIYAMQRFARTVRPDLDAVTNALTEGCSNGQTEGQINRLKTLKRAMYGRAGALWDIGPAKYRNSGSVTRCTSVESADVATILRGALVIYKKFRQFG